MNIFFARLLLVIAILSGIEPIAASADAAADIALFQQRYAAMHDASVAHDRAAMLALFADGFVSIDLKDIRLTAAQVADQILAAPKDSGNIGKTEVLAVTISGDTAKVRQTYQATGSKTSSDGKQHVMTLQARSSDVWVLHNGTWLLRETRTDEVAITADGYQMLHKVRPGSL